MAVLLVPGARLVSARSGVATQACTSAGSLCHTGMLDQRSMDAQACQPTMQMQKTK